MPQQLPSLLKAAMLLLIALIASSPAVLVKGDQGYRKCIQTKDEFMSHTVTGGDVNDDPANHLLCECRGTSDDGDYMLLCSLFDTWDYCPPTFDNAEPVCASILFGQTFNDNGQVIDRFRNYDYVDERMGTVTVQRLPFTNECIVTVDSDQCKSCEIVDYCDANSQLNQALYESNLPSSEEMGIFTDLKVDCTNVNAAALFECGIADGAGNLLSILNGYPVSPDDIVVPTRPPQQTIDPNAFPPTITPVTLPSPTTLPPVSSAPSEEASNTTTAPSMSIAPSEVAGEPTTSPSLSMVPSVSLAPSASSAPSGAPTITGQPTRTNEPTHLPTYIQSMEPTQSKIMAASDTRGVDSAASSQQTSSSSTTTVILFFFSAIASFFLLAQ